MTSGETSPAITMSSDTPRLTVLVAIVEIDISYTYSVKKKRRVEQTLIRDLFELSVMSGLLHNIEKLL